MPKFLWRERKRPTNIRVSRVISVAAVTVMLSRLWKVLSIRQVDASVDHVERTVAMPIGIINHKENTTLKAICRRGVLLTVYEEPYVGQAHPNHHCCHNTVHTPDGNSDLSKSLRFEQ